MHGAAHIPGLSPVVCPMILASAVAPLTEDLPGPPRQNCCPGKRESRVKALGLRGSSWLARRPTDAHSESPRPAALPAASTVHLLASARKERHSGFHSGTPCRLVS